MAKDNLFLGFGRGSVGDVVFYRQGGHQVARARNRSPKNPKTALQLLQRVVLKTASGAYSFMQDICNHSFQGCAEGTECQSRFNALNVQRFRNQLAMVINSGDPEEILTSGEYNFASKGASLVERNAYIVSDGSLTTIPVDWSTASTEHAFIIAVDLGSATPSYGDIIDALALQAGDQLTFMSLSIDDTDEGGQFNGFEYARVILEPAGGDYSVPFITGNAITDPNDKNRGDFTFDIIQSGTAYYLTFCPVKFSNAAQVKNAVAAATVIVSRFSGNTWQRSKQQLVLRTDRMAVPGHLSFNHDIDYLGDAVYSFIDGDSSLLYLNQAGASSKREIVIPDAHLVGVSANGHGLARNGSLTLASGTGALDATMANGLDGSSYVLALIAQGSSSPYKSQTFSTDSATIADMALVENTVYDVVLLEDGVIIDTFGSLTYQTTPATGQITAATIMGTPIQKNGTASYGQLPLPIAVSVSGYNDGNTYKVAVRNKTSQSLVGQTNVSAATTTISSGAIEQTDHYEIVLICNDSVIETWGDFYWIDEG